MTTTFMQQGKIGKIGEKIIFVKINEKKKKKKKKKKGKKKK